MDSRVISLGFGNEHKQTLYRLTFNNTPIISWYRIDTGEFINASVPDGTIITPIPKMYKSLAKPNVEVSVNGIIRNYGDYWRFGVSPEAEYEIVFSQMLTSILMPHDVIKITYTKLLN